MTHTAGEWHQERDGGREPARIVSIDRTTSTMTVGVVLPYGVTFGGTDTIKLTWQPDEPRQDGNRAQRRAYRFGRRTKR